MSAQHPCGESWRLQFQMTAMSVSRGPFENQLCPIPLPFYGMQTHSSPRLLQQCAPHYPQIGQRKQRVQLRRVFEQVALAIVLMPELVLDHPERAFDLGTDARLVLFQVALISAQRCALVHLLTFAWSHRHVPVDQRASRLLALPTPR